MISKKWEVNKILSHKRAIYQKKEYSRVKSQHLSSMVKKMKSISNRNDGKINK